MNHRKKYKSSETISSYNSIDSSISNSTLETYNMNLTEGSRLPNQKVNFNPKVQIIEIENNKRYNLKNSISLNKIYENLLNEKKRRIQEKAEKEEEARRQENCNGCFIF